MSDRMTHAQLLPQIRADNDAWRAEHLPRLRAADDERRAARAEASALFAKLTKDCTDAERALLQRFWSIGA